MLNIQYSMISRLSCFFD